MACIAALAGWTAWSHSLGAGADALDSAAYREHSPEYFDKCEAVLEKFTEELYATETSIRALERYLELFKRHTFYLKQRLPNDSTLVDAFDAHFFEVVRAMESSLQATRDRLGRATDISIL